MTKLTTMMPGTEVTMTVTSRTASGTDPRPGTWTHTVKVLGEQSVSVTAGTFRTVPDRRPRPHQGNGGL